MGQHIELVTKSPWNQPVSNFYGTVTTMIEEVRRGERSIDDITADMVDSAILEAKYDADKLVKLAKLLGMTLGDAEKELSKCPGCQHLGTCNLRLIAQAMMDRYPSKGKTSLDDPFEVRLTAIAEVMDQVRPTSDVSNAVFYGTVREASEDEGDEKLLALAAAAKLDEPAFARHALSLMTQGSDQQAANPKLKPVYAAVLRSEVA